MVQGGPRQQRVALASNVLALRFGVWAGPVFAGLEAARSAGGVV